jgi:membrane protein DedA with SNARE-associated domain
LVRSRVTFGGPEIVFAWGGGAVDVSTLIIGAVVGALAGGVVVYWLGRSRRGG